MQPLVELEESNSGFAFGFRFPYLPDLLANPREAGGLLGNPVAEAYERQIAFLRAYAARPPAESALQLRYISWPGEGRSIELVLLGVDCSSDAAHDLRRLVSRTLPPEIPVEELDEPDLRAVIDPFAGRVLDGERFAELRRALEPIEISDDAPDGGGLYGSVPLSWTWSPYTLTYSLEVLRAQTGVCLLGVHVEPVRPRAELRDYLAGAVAHFASERKDDVDPVLGMARALSLERLRALRRGVLHTRVYLVGDDPLIPGSPEFFGADFARGTDAGPGSFDVVRPRTPDESAAAGRLVRCLEVSKWGIDPGIDPELEDILFLFEPREANLAFRIPVTPRGGLAGIATSRLGGRVAGFQPRRATGPGVAIGSGSSIGEFRLSLRDVNEHVLVAGVPGSGKTTTVQRLLAELWTEHSVPFLVIEPAKSDYVRLADVLGDACVRLAITPDATALNPLSVPAGSSVLAHAGRVLAAFDTSFQLSEAFPLGRLLLSRALRNTYAAAGVPERADSNTRWPTLADLYRHTAALIRAEGWKGEMSANARASLLGRLDYLLEGGVGDSLCGGPTDGLDWDALYKRPTILEFREVPGPDDRALLFGIVLAGLVSHAEIQRPRDSELSGLAHVTVLEEAHRVLRRGPAENYGALLFSEAIAELRGAGEGFIVSDQAPSRLLPDVIKNVGTLLCHRLTEGAERNAMAESMMLSRGQRDDLGRLPTGRLFALSGSLNDAVVVDANPLPRAASSKVGYATLAANTPVRAWCQLCPRPCDAPEGIAAGEALAAWMMERSSTVGADALADEAARVTDTSSHALAAYCASAKAVSVAFAHNSAMRHAMQNELFGHFAEHVRTYRKQIESAIKEGKSV